MIDRLGCASAGRPAQRASCRRRASNTEALAPICWLRQTERSPAEHELQFREKYLRPLAKEVAAESLEARVYLQLRRADHRPEHQRKWPSGSLATLSHGGQEQLTGKRGVSSDANTAAPVPDSDRCNSRVSTEFR